ncbi:YdbL family protein [Desulfovibrio ferrophilus]|uniref:DUF1318 domain-containing protein n=1 Tax=Desulfovibrio ferrophilus TaxID=241368 RepID=A0A2Z6AY96_9BACT|nr:DUF1318 domain-containing protein [Desulfovibrio ferrophilus]BBD08237.1 uncharacterized protein DFE_1511 [Desulfovibrio ferrophilus]
MKKLISTAALIVLAIALCSGVAHAGNLKEQMKARVPQINALKAEQAIGENNKGFLEALKDKAGPLVAAENKDRKAVYAAIAKKNGVDPLFVGERRAAKLRKLATPGEMLQAPDGTWYKK